MRNLLNRIFVKRRASVIVPLVTAAMMYMLFFFFGQSENKRSMLLIVPVISAIWYWGAYFVFWIQTKNPSCPQWFFDLAQLIALAVFGLGSVSLGLQFLTNMADHFSLFLCPAIITWSAIALVHGKQQ